MYKTIIHDKQGMTLHPGDKVHCDWGYDLTVCIDKNEHWYGKLVCEAGHSCKNIPYSLNENEITLITESMTKEDNKKYYDALYNWFIKCPIDYEIFTEFPTGEVLADGWRFDEMIKDITVALKLHKRYIGDYSND